MVEWGLQVQHSRESGEHAKGFYYNAACAHALAGRKDRAFALLELAITKGYSNLMSLGGDPDLFGRAISYMNLPPAEYTIQVDGGRNVYGPYTFMVRRINLTPEAVPAPYTLGTTVNAGTLVASRLSNGTLTIAAGGGHNLLMIGPPGSG